jgi:hypothetical protein
VLSSLLYKIHYTDSSREQIKQEKKKKGIRRSEARFSSENLPHESHEGRYDSGDVTPLILNICTRWR